jgi:hypothetical protein
MAEVDVLGGPEVGVWSRQMDDTRAWSPGPRIDSARKPREKSSNKKVVGVAGPLESLPQEKWFGSAVLPLPCPRVVFEGVKRVEGLAEVFLTCDLLESCRQRVGFVGIAWNDRPLFLSQSRVAPAQQQQVGDPNLARLGPGTHVEAG